MVCVSKVYQKLFWLLPAIVVGAKESCKGIDGPQNGAVGFATFDDLKIGSSPPQNYSLMNFSGWKVTQPPFEIKAASPQHVILAEDPLTGNFSLASAYGNKNMLELESFDLACYYISKLFPGRFISDCKFAVTAYVPRDFGDFNLRTKRYSYDAPKNPKKNGKKVYLMENYNGGGLMGQQFIFNIEKGPNTVGMVLDNIKVKYSC